MLTLASSGDGAVVDDNAAAINAMLSDYNDSVPTPPGCADEGGFCDIAAPVGAGRSRSVAPAWLALAFGVLLQRARARSRRRTNSA